jgi:hypothetical protein
LLVWIRRADAFNEQTLVRPTWRNRSRFDRILRNVEPKLSLPLSGVGSVAMKAVLRQNRANVAIEVENVSAGRLLKKQRQDCCGEESHTAHYHRRSQEGTFIFPR